MKRVGLYAGSFNPWHKGHEDVLYQAMPLFDEIVIAHPQDKPFDLDAMDESLRQTVVIMPFQGLLVHLAEQVEASAIIRGLRNGVDFEYEKSMLYWNQDLGLTVPTIYFISDRELVHISSSAIRKLRGMK